MALGVDKQKAGSVSWRLSDLKVRASREDAEGGQ